MWALYWPALVREEEVPAVRGILRDHVECQIYGRLKGDEACASELVGTKSLSACRC